MVKKAMIFKKYDIAVFFVIVILCAASFLIPVMQSGGASSDAYAVVSVKGKEVYRADLSAISEPYSKEFFTDGGAAVIVFSPDGAYFERSDCPDKVCEHFGKVTLFSGGAFCVPLRISLYVTSDHDGFDAVSQ